jgi:hypothetical protein
MSIREIASKLEVSTSTVSRWCSGIKLSPNQRALLESKRRQAGLQALAPYIERNRKNKIDDIQSQIVNGKDDVGEISARDLYMLGLGLYWGEGYKRGSQEWGFTNSDPLLIRAVIKWMQDFYEIEIDRFIARITINDLYAHKNDELLRFWEKETAIPLSQFSPSTFIKGYGKPDRDSKTYHGTLRLKIRNSTSLRRRILASIAAAANQI